MLSLNKHTVHESEPFLFDEMAQEESGKKPKIAKKGNLEKSYLSKFD